MSANEQPTPWLKRIEDLIEVLEGSSIGELELTEKGTEIIIRRHPEMVLIPHQQALGTAGGHQIVGAAPKPAEKEDRSLALVTPLTGVFYTAPAPTQPAFVNIGDVVNVGQVVALVEAMKVFNEIQAEVTGRVTKFVAENGSVVQKGDVLMRVEPL